MLRHILVPAITARALLAALIALAAVTVSPRAARAEVLRLEVTRREPYAGGREFGKSGPYEAVSGIVRYAVDPKAPAQRAIVDLERAPRRSDGRVEFAADFYLLKPLDPARGNGALFYDVNNRGGRVALGFFNSGPGRKPDSGEAGDGFLMEAGYTIVWSGWIGELLPGNGRLLLQAPVAAEGEKEITGPARFETSCDAPSESLPLSRRDGHGSYAPTARGEAEAQLTWRLRESDRRIAIPRGEWSVLRAPLADPAGGVPGTLGQIRLKVAGGCQPGYLYEVVYEARGPIVQGLGYAAVRDLVSFLRHDSREELSGDSGSAEGQPKGLGALRLDRAIGFGVSQSGRFLRNFLYLGFNLDEKGRKVFDALMPHVAGGGLGFFNHRFAQPTRHNGQHEDHLYPTDVFPFAYGAAVDPFTGRSDAVLPRRLPPESLPRVFHTQSSAEYWHRSGSLVHTDALGERDAEIPEAVRIYVFGGAQHGPAGRPPSRGSAQNLANPGDYRPFLRALLSALDEWVRVGTPPPPSIYPLIADGTLIPPERYLEEFPAPPGVRPPEVLQRPCAADYGPEFREKGIIALEPPRVLGSYPVLVPRPDRVGNDRGTLLVPEAAAPLATYTGWNLRARAAGAENELASLAGSYFPLPRTRAEREAAGDRRPSVEEIYRGFEEYRRRFAAVCAGLVERRYLLAEDARLLVEAREGEREAFAGVGGN
jgi:hypothetical protein